MAKNKNISPEDVMKFLLEANKPGSEYHLWDVNPSYRNLNVFIIMLRFFVASIMVFSFLFFLGNLLIPFYLYLFYALFMILFFLFVFSAEWFSLRNLFRRIFNKKIECWPFEDLVFWKVKSHDEMIFFSNKRELTHVGMGVFRTEILPENVSASFISLLRALAGKAARIPFTYQVVQVPRYALKENHFEQVLKEDEESAKKTTHTRIYIIIPVCLNGVFIPSFLEDLTSELNRRLNIFKTFVFHYFHHYKLTLLQGKELLFALRTFFLPISVEDKDEKDKNEEKELSRFFVRFIEPILRIIFLLIYFTMWYQGLVYYEVNNLMIMLSIVLLFIGVLFAWWRKPLFSLTHFLIRHHSNLDIINPFRRMRFYQYRGYSEMLFIQSGAKKMIIRMLNLRNLIYPHYLNMSKFLRAIMGHGIRFSYTLINSPLSVKDISKELKKSSFLAENPLLFQKQIEEYKKENYLSSHGGFYRTMLLLSIQINIKKYHLTNEDLESIDEESKRQVDILATNLLTASLSQNLEVEFLRSRKLVMGTAVQMVKTKMIRTFGTHLIYQVMQGTELQAFFDMPDELKKAIATKIGSEFLTPLDLENFITIGYGIDLEYHGKQGPAGFTEEQLNALLISHGTEEQRQLLLMKIAKELAIRDRPCIIFDFYGNWTKLIRHFDNIRGENRENGENSLFIDKFSYQAIGVNFILDLLQSGIPNDPDNVRYLEYFYRVFCLAFKKPPSTTAYLRKFVKESLDRKLSADGIAMGYENDYLQPPSFMNNQASPRTTLELLEEINNPEFFYLLKAEEQFFEEHDFPLKEVMESKKIVIINLYCPL